jgi:hypothetical protein
MSEMGERSRLVAYVGEVIRTHIYLTEVQRAGLDAKAQAEGSTRNDVVRTIIDRELNLAENEDLDALFEELAPELAEAARTCAAGDPELRSG